MAVVWSNIISIMDGIIPVVYQQETSPPDEGTGAGNRHRIVQSGVPYGPYPQGYPARSPGYIASSGFDPGDSLHFQIGDGNPRLFRIVDLTP